VTEPELVVERRPGVLLLGINRPEKRNALSLALADAMRDALRAAEREEPAVLVVHSTTPGSFVAGADINELLARTAEDAMLSINAGLFDALEAFRWPSIAVIDGAAMGGGCELALACDLRVGSPRARFGQPEPDLGILAGAGGNWRLPQLVGVGVARRMLYTGEVLDADAALQLGLLDAVHDPDDVLAAALELAGRIARRSWRALELTKLALRLHRPATTSFDVAAQALLFESEDKRTRMTAFLNRPRR
jgi:enoyl-CoA hydratase